MSGGGNITIVQDTINHPIDGQILLGIPFKLNVTSFLPVSLTDIYLYNQSGSLTYKDIKTTKRNIKVIFYNDAFNINFNSSRLVFSTSIAYNPIFDPGQPSNSKSGVFKVSRYCTDLHIDDVDINQTITTRVAWTSSDIDIDYTDDPIFLSLYSNNTFIQLFDTVNYNAQLTNSQFNNLQSGNYYFIYTFNSISDYDYVSGSQQQYSTNTFSFTTQSIQSISANNSYPSSPSVIIITGNFGDGYSGYSYTLSINGFSVVTTLPYNYTPPSILNTATYTASISNTSISTTFTVYQYVTIITIANKIIQSLQNYLSWAGGSTTESFQSGNTTLSTIYSSTTFNQSNPLDARSLSAGTPYLIQPANTNENNQSYGYSYFDSIPPNQIPTVSGSNGPFLSNSTLTWNASYTSTNSPDGLRQYPVTIGSNAGLSNYNTLSISNTNLSYGIPYTIQLLDITIATNYLFYEKPYNVTITPCYINYPNTITWTSSTNPSLYVIMGSVTFQDKSPVVKQLTQANATTNSSSILFWPPNSSSANAVSSLSYTLSPNSFTFWNGGIVPLFQDISFSIQVGSYLYPQDTFSLSLYRNGTIVQVLETSITSPFTWKPYTYTVDYQANDQLKLQSNQYINYGLSSPFTFQINASVTLDNTSYSIFSTITSTLHIDVTPIPTFRVYLYSTLNKFTPLLLTTTNQSTYSFQPSYIISLNSSYLNTDVYLLYKLYNSNTMSIQSPTFQLYQNSTVTLDQPNYTIISTIISTLNIPTVSPSSFTVQLMDSSNTPYLITSYMTQNVVSFKAYEIVNTSYVDSNVYLKFTLNSSPSITIQSPVFQISSTYFTLDQPTQLVPEFARATSNVICVTQKKNNVPTTTISIKDRVATPTAVTGQAQYIVPCGILPYIDELNALLPMMSIRSSLLFLIQKYSIPIPSVPIVNKKRYQYPTADAKQLQPILQFNTTFHLGEYTLGNPVNTNPLFSEKIYDARILSIANDDTKTVSSYYTDMLVKAMYWLNTLPPFKKDGAFIYCVIRPINGSVKQFISATISLLDNQLILTPIILKYLLLLYVPYQEGDITILYSSTQLTDIINYMNANFYKDFLDGKTAL